MTVFERKRRIPVFWHVCILFLGFMHNSGGFTVFRGGCGSRVGAGLPGSVGCGGWAAGWHGFPAGGWRVAVVCSPGSLIAVRVVGGRLLPGSMFPWLLSWCDSRVVGCCYPALSRFPSVAVGYCSLPARCSRGCSLDDGCSPGVIPRGLVGACSFSLSRRMVRCSCGGCWLVGALLRVVGWWWVLSCGRSMVVGVLPGCWIARGGWFPGWRLALGVVVGSWLAVVLFDSPVAVPRGWLLLVR